ncbi:AsmA family protein [Shimia abyssi]|uniref:AsmA family protein n=1 Tax=Shimia abyssi TaxID=1662395 RepID=UPI0013FE0EB8|nr:AsmA family protein [Shimia abyssi]
MATALLADFLEDEEVEIGDAKLKVWARAPTLVLQDLRVSDPSRSDQDLTKVDLVQVSLSMPELLRGSVEVETILVTGFFLNLDVNANGVSNWRPRTQQNSRPIEREFPLMASLLAERNVDFVNSGVRYRHAPSGFVFNFELDEFSSRQTRRETLTRLQGVGKINGEPFEILGSFPDGPNFEVSSRLGSSRVALKGVADDPRARTGFTGKLSLEAKSISEFLSVFRLKPVLEGTISASADVVRTPNRFSFSDLIVVAESAQHKVEVTGEIGNLINWAGGDLLVEYLNTSTQEMLPSVPDSIDDVTILNASAHVVSTAKDLVVEDMSIQSNLANPLISRLGPISVDRVFRTPDGMLRVDGIEILAGPEDAQVIRVSGELANLLSLEGLSAEGQIDVKFAELIEGPTKGITEFGDLRGSFGIDNLDGSLGLRALTVKSENSDLWDFSLAMRSRDLFDLEKFRGSASLAFPDLNRIAGKLNMDATPLSSLVLEVSVEGEEEALVTDVNISVDDSAVALHLEKSYEEQLVSFLGYIKSEILNVDTVSHLINLVKDVSNQPKTSEMGRPVQPIWLDDAIKPLILDEPFLAVDPEELVEALFAKIDVRLQKVSGLPGVPRLNSVLALKDGLASLQPVSITLPTGAASFGLFVNTLDDLDAVRATGNLTSISIKELTDMLNVPFEMSGTINGNFNIFASISSLDALAETMYGHLNLKMGNGRVGTSLIKLAGLGIIPWLFSKDLWQGYSDIMCISAPLVIQPGRVFSNGFVLETGRVQVVAKGTADYRQNRIAIHAEPRRVNQPLSRSFFPIEVFGELTAPKVRLLRNSKLSAPERDASTSHGARQRQPCVMDKSQH